MDKDKIKSEILEMINDNPVMTASYLKIRENYLLRLHCQYDPIRIEICKCITHGLFQASITLTNHYLEKFMKTSLIYHSAGFKTIDENTFSQLEPHIDKFDSLDLEDTINRACTAGIISKAEKSALKKFKETFRNAYSHAEAKKLFKDIGPINLVMGSFNGGLDVRPLNNVKPYSILPFHGHMQQQAAQRDAIPYFKAVDKIVCRTEMERYPEAFKETPEHS